MKTFAVHCDYPPIYRAEVTVEAEEAFKRCLIGKLRLPAPDQQSRYDHSHDRSYDYWLRLWLVR